MTFPIFKTEAIFIKQLLDWLNKCPTHEHYYIHVDIRESGCHEVVARCSDEISNQDWSVEFLN